MRRRALDRIDRHLEASIRAQDDFRAAQERFRVAQEGFRVAQDDFRVELRQSGLRQERLLGELTRVISELRAEIHDSRDERRAYISAVYKLIDRLPPPHAA